MPASLALAILTAALDPAGQALAAPATQELPPRITVRVHPPVELLSIVFRLAGNPEYSQGKVPGYLAAVEARFRPHAEHPAVKLAQELRQTRGVSYDAVAGLAVHLDGDLQPLVPLDPRPEGLDARWGDRAPEFLEQLRDFAEVTGFATFLAAEEAFYQGTVQRMQQRIAESAEITWFEGFFGQRPGSRFILTIAPVNGGHNYGPRVVHPDGSEDLHSVMGVWNLDGSSAPVFPEEVVPILIHEFCHSWCNPLIDEHEAAFAEVGRALHGLVADPMAGQAYATWDVVLKESLVRASVVRYLTTTQGPLMGQLEIGAQQRRCFYWTQAIAAALARYEADREKWQTLDDFVPELVAAFGKAVQDTAALLKTLPRITKLEPADDATDVDPTLTAIRIHFDRPMTDQSWSVVKDGVPFPEITGTVAYDKSKQVLTIPVRLQPGTTYGFWLNRGGPNMGFRSADGRTLQPVRVRFRTGG